MKPIVIKISGKAIEQPEQSSQLWTAIETYAKDNPVIVVHGGGNQVDKLLNRLGEPIKRVGGVRLTPESQINEVAAVLAGQVNLQLVGVFQTAGILAVGINLGAKGVIECSLNDALNGETGRVGVPQTGEAPLLELLTANKYVPVVSSIGLDSLGRMLNVNADDAAAAIAVSVSAKSLFYITDVDGVLDSDGNHVGHISIAEIEPMIAAGTAAGGMAAKLRSAADALNSTDIQVHITSPHNVAAMLTGRQSVSTLVSQERVGA